MEVLATALPTRVAVGALLEIGRPDLAVMIRPNRIGAPTLAGSGKAIGNYSLDPIEELWIIRAFNLGHRSHCSTARLSLDSFGQLGTTCDTCERIRQIRRLARRNN